VTTSDRDVVAALGEEIARRIGEPRYRLWFDQHTNFSWQADRLLVGVPNHFFQEWLQNTFLEEVRDAAGVVLGRPMQVRFAIDPELFQAARRAQAAGAASPIPPAAAPAPPRGPRRPSGPGTGGGCRISWSGPATAWPTHPPSASSRRPVRGPTRW
jgi:chromosomal replication initiation ATPase DnaA